MTSSSVRRDRCVRRLAALPPSLLDLRRDSLNFEFTEKRLADSDLVSSLNCPEGAGRTNREAIKCTLPEGAICTLRNLAVEIARYFPCTQLAKTSAALFRAKPAWRADCMALWRQRKRASRSPHKAFTEIDEVRGPGLPVSDAVY
jgi:hypothetical protein